MVGMSGLVHPPLTSCVGGGGVADTSRCSANRGNEPPLAAESEKQ